MSSDLQERVDLARTVAELLADLGGEERLREVVAGDGWDEALWRRVLDLGVLELALAANRDADGGSYADLAVVFAELGRALAPVPALTTVAVATVLDLSGTPAAAELAEDVVSGRVRAALVLPGDGGTWGGRTPLRARSTNGAWTVDGTVELVTDAPGVDQLVVLADTDDGACFFVVPTGPAVTITPVPALDLTRTLGSVALTAAPATPLTTPDRTDAVLARTLDVCAGLLAAESAGLARRALDSAVDYAKIRVQFDRPIGSFQAVKHSCAEMLLMVEGARCLADAAADALDEGDPGAASLAAGVARGYAGETAVECAERCLHLHGGIGFTWEHVSHLVVRRAKSDAVRFGRPAEHWDRVARRLATGTPGAAPAVAAAAVADPAVEAAVGAPVG
ncbi:acyl-CoA dehydrogenase family protein [uncultured Modestobacter sp.]|uniref:acyl-CoA dehydrogenase family protein n=1 Tax=uncultured Modestobacter sp. TaxID=380048 RepID=UPI00261A10C3|nr:acyl-CoA dehydrogenase family protein [uncultured Modestobacter sp.]